MENCPHFQRCSANICPMDKELLKRTWFVDEEVCRRKEFKNHPVVVAQKYVVRQYKRGVREIRTKRRKVDLTKSPLTGEELLAL